MRFIGSKINLLNEIDEIVKKNCLDSSSFCDLFSGTTCVGNFFKKDFTVISNDLLYFSYVLQKAFIQSNKKPVFNELKKINIDDPLKFFNDYEPKIGDLNYKPFILDNYTPSSNKNRLYFSNENGLKIDYIRQKIETWKDKKLINDEEYYYLIACLIEAVPYISNIAGTYGAYLKNWDKRAFNKLKLIHFEVLNNNKKNMVFNKESNTLIKEIEGDILYIDPPYNSRQYLPNYHILETISKYDYPIIYGKTGLRPYKEERSKYCIKRRVLEEFSNLIRNANFKYIIVSYSSEGLMSEEDIKSILIQNGIESTYKLKKIPYRRYKHTKGEVKHNLNEYLFFIKKR